MCDIIVDNSLHNDWTLTDSYQLLHTLLSTIKVQAMFITNIITGLTVKCCHLVTPPMCMDTEWFLLCGDFQIN